MIIKKNSSINLFKKKHYRSFPVSAHIFLDFYVCYLESYRLLCSMSDIRDVSVVKFIALVTFTIDKHK